MQHSESIAKIAEALAAFQSEVKDPRRDGNNPHFKSKYVQIDGLLDAVRPVLSKHGLSVVQSTGGNGQDISVTTMILHASGEWIETDALVLKAQQVTPQGAGSAVTYGRRYGLSAALGVAWDDDDDGNEASTPPSKTKAAQKAKAKADAGDKDMLIHSIATMAKELGANSDDLKEVMRRHFDKTASAELTYDEAVEMDKHFVAWVAEIKDDEMKLMEGIA